jgi:glycosyltransferase involved in cell wall biosynthesis
VALQQKSIERANAIIAVSQNTKKDLLRLFNVDEKKVHVIYHGIEIPTSEELAGKKLFVYPYILFVGRRSKYKNFKNFVLAFARIHKLYPEIKVVCTSSTFNQEEYSLFKSNEVEGCFVNINATEHEMNLLYRDALLFIFPSYYEGFGMPILEAWSCNCPVAVSDASCFPEIAKDGALYFKPDDVDGMSAVMEKLISDDNLRLDLIARGQNRVKDFSWKKTAQKHLEIYENLI